MTNVNLANPVAMTGTAPVIRPARREDCAAMLAIYNHYVQNDTCTYRTELESLEERLAWFDDHGPLHPVFVAQAGDHGNKIVGWASLSPYSNRGGYRMTVENSVYLDPDWRGRGLGTALLAQLIDSAINCGHHTIIAAISAEQTASVALHRRLGFEVAGRVAEVGHKFGRWLDVVYMQLSLDLTIAVESPRQLDVVAMIAQLDDYLVALYPPECSYRLDIEALCAPNIRFFVARRRGEAVGCAALRIDRSDGGDDYGEVKRMFVLPQARRGQLGKRLLARLEAQARLEGLPTLRLETGTRQHEALGLYRAVGFTDRGPFAAYPPHPLTVFLEKAI